MSIVLIKLQPAPCCLTRFKFKMLFLLSCKILEVSGLPIHVFIKGNVVLETLF